MDTDGSDTSPSGTPTKKSKSLSSSESTPVNKSSPAKAFSPPKIYDLNDDLNLSETSSEGEIISEAELTETEPPKSPTIAKLATPQTSPSKSLDKVKSASKTVTFVDTSPKSKSPSLHQSRHLLRRSRRIRRFLLFHLSTNIPSALL